MVEFSERERQHLLTVYSRKQSAVKLYKEIRKEYDKGEREFIN